MRILRQRETWRRPSPKRVAYIVNTLEPKEREHIRVALRQLARKAGSVRALAEKLGASYDTLRHALERHERRVSAGLALRAARYAEAPVEELLAGRWPRPGACPMCGRHREVAP